MQCYSDMTGLVLVLMLQVEERSSKATHSCSGLASTAMRCEACSSVFRVLEPFPVIIAAAAEHSTELDVGPPLRSGVEPVVCFRSPTHEYVPPSTPLIPLSSHFVRVLPRHHHQAG